MYQKKVSNYESLPPIEMNTTKRTNYKVKTEMEEPQFDEKLSSMKKSWIDSDKRDKYQRMKNKQMMNRTSKQFY